MFQRADSIVEFDLNNVEGHRNYEYTFMLDRIETIMLEKNKDDDIEETKGNGENPVTKCISTKTSWVNFDQICNEINREQQHILDFVKSELDVEGSFGSEGNLILQTRIQNKFITSLYKKYLTIYVKCNDCKCLDTKLEKD